MTSAGDDLRGLRWNGNWSLVDPSNEPAFVVSRNYVACASVFTGAFLSNLPEVRGEGGAGVDIEMKDPAGQLDAFANDERQSPIAGFVKRVIY